MKKSFFTTIIFLWSAVFLSLQAQNCSAPPAPSVNWSGCAKSGAFLQYADLSGADLSGADLSGADLYGANLTGANLTGANLSGARLLNALMPGANLSGADLSGASMFGVRSGGNAGTPSALPTDWVLVNGYLVGPVANLSGANLANANLTGANIGSANLTGADLTGANLSGINAGYVTLIDADLTGADLTGVNMTAANMTNANFTNANLINANVRSTSLVGANMTGANMTGASLYEANMSGANVSGANLSGANLTIANLTNANLTNANLTIANLTNANLTGATLTGVASGGIEGTPYALPSGWALIYGYLVGPGADLSNAFLQDADLSGANLSGANLSGANLIGANLTNANLSGANLTNANLTNAKLTIANLTNANLTGATLTGVASGGIEGTPYALPSGWALIYGYLVGPGADLSNAFLQDADLSGANLSGANLSGANLIGANLTNANLTIANLTNANLTRANLTGANVSGANLSGVLFYLANLSGLNLVGADLSGLNLFFANLSDADLSDADLSNAYMEYANLSGADLSGADLSGAALNFVNLTDANLTGATLTGVATGGGITGTPYALPTGWALVDGYLVRTFTVTFDVNGGTTPSPATISVTYNAPYGALATASRPCYTFNGWFTESNGGTEITSASIVAINSDQTLYAQWTAINYNYTETIVACGSYEWHGTTYNASNNTATWTGTNAAGCDSIVSLDLTLTPFTTNTVSVSACDSYTWPVNGQTYTASGTHIVNAGETVFFNSLSGLTSAVAAAGYTLSATQTFNSIAQGYASSLTGSFDAGSPTWTANAPNGLFNGEAGGSMTISTTSGQVPLTISFSPGVTSVGANFFITSTYFETVSGTITLNLSDGSTQSFYTNTANSFGGFVSHGAYITSIIIATSIGYVTVDNLVVSTGTINACVSEELNLTINHPSSSTETIVACGSYEWHGTTYTSSNNTATWTGQNAAGCDSIVTLNLTINQPSYTTETIVACGSYEWHGTTYTSSTNNNTGGLIFGAPTWTGTNAAGCDSIVTLNLTIHQPSYFTETIVACGSYEWHGTIYTSSTNDNGGIFGAGAGSLPTWTGTNAAGCDSIVSLNLTVNDCEPPVINCPSSLVINNCNSFLTLGDPTITDNSGSFENLSILNSNLSFDGVNDFVNTILDVSETAFTVEMWFKTNQTNGGIFMVKDGGGGYDRTVILTNGNIEARTYNDETIVTSGTNYADNNWHHLAFVLGQGGQKLYVDGILKASGIKSASDFHWQDRIAIGKSFSSPSAYFSGKITEFRIWNAARTQAEIIANMNARINPQAGLALCYHFNEGDLSGNNIGRTTAQDGSGNGNDGTLLNFDLTGSSSNWFNSVTNDAPATFPFGTTLVNWTAQDLAGNTSTCTQTVTIVNNVSYTTETIVACGSYEWHGTTYTTSNNTATWTGTNAAGCDSIVTLNLTINQPSYTTETIVACGSYEWHGTTYTSSTNNNTGGLIFGAPTWTGTNAAGCDSIVTLNLTINQPSYATETITACGSYAWHDSTYTASTNTATWTGTNAAGCDSIVTLNLTIKSAPTATITGNTTFCAGGNTILTTNATSGGGGSVMATAAGAGHSLFLKNDGTVWATGINNYGQLGDGTNVDKNTPVQLSGLNGITAMAGGALHSLFLQNDGTVWATGNNNYGQLGDGTYELKNTPVQVSGLSGISAIIAGDFHSLFLKNDGSVWAVGANQIGQFGDGTYVSTNIPVQVSGLSGITAMAGGSVHSLFLKNDGTVWATGYNGEGQLGDGTYVYKNTPVQVSGLSGITAITVRASHSLFLKSDGTVWATGYNEFGQLGDGTYENKNTPVQVSGLSDFTSIAAGASHSLFLMNDGTLWATGFNNFGQFGDGTNVTSNIPVQVSGLSGTTAIAAGYNHSLFLKNDGTVWATGYNNFGQLGDGTYESKNTPVPVSGFDVTITSYQWKLNGSDIVGATNATYTATAAGNYTFEVTNSNGCSTSESVNVTVNQPSTAPTSISSSVAFATAGVNFTLSVNGGSLGTGATWKWYTGSCGGTLIGTGASISVSQTANTTYFVRAEGTCNTTACATITVNSQCGATGITSSAGTTAICAGSPVTLTVIGSLSPGAQWRWDDECDNDDDDSYSNTATFTVSPNSTKTYFVRSVGGACGLTACVPVTVNVIPKPATPGTISGSASVCPSTSVTYTIAAVAGATSYTWTAPTNATLVSAQGGTSMTVAYAGAFTSGTLKVKANNCSGSSSDKSLSIAKQVAPATPGNISGASAPCKGSTQTYSIAAVTGATSYTWALPTGVTFVTGSSQTGTSIQVVVASTFNSGTLSVKANNCGGSSSNRTTTLTGQSAPTAPGTISGPSSVTQNTANNTFSVSNVAGMTYNWAVPAGCTITLGQGTSTIKVTWGTVAGTVSVTRNNGCGNSVASTKSVSVKRSEEAEADAGMESARTEETVETLVTATDALNTIAVYPNPTTGEARITFNTTTTGKYALSIVDLQGRVINSTSGAAIEGNNNIDINLSNCSNGVYMIHLMHNDSLQTLRVVKL